MRQAALEEPSATARELAGASHDESATGVTAALKAKMVEVADRVVTARKAARAELAADSEV